MKVEQVYVNDLGEALKYLNANSDTICAHIEKLEKGMKLLKKQNSCLAMAVLCLGGMLYFANAKVKSLELKVNTLDDINRFMKDESSDDNK